MHVGTCCIVGAPSTKLVAGAPGSSATGVLVGAKGSESIVFSACSCSVGADAIGRAYHHLGSCDKIRREYP